MVLEMFEDLLKEKTESFYLQKHSGQLQTVVKCILFAASLIMSTTWL